ncbi:quinol monooxygenase YgiN [Jatrophihabitans sp. GAS493]|uniref:putative quinol monooxygenase n=1 Tax=Jatrophihabitans sp. GAS493 TaxID=1907575 RepID=UPI000BB99C18|nr:antibiotic biosynthesis monooxygenase [Jatrophihabitans sp. GAS493]SOD71873.1 quinol monooxygenase YgiN [Jatrophihabitans sp. GAS493]
MEGFGLIVRHIVKAGHEPEFDRLAATAAARIRELEPGTLVYLSHAVAGEPRIRVFYELYRDEQAFAEHERQPHVRDFLTAREQHLDGIEVEFLNVVEGKPPA